MVLFIAERQSNCLLLTAISEKSADTFLGTGGQLAAHKAEQGSVFSRVMPMLLEYAPPWHGFITLYLLGECLLAQGHLFDLLPYPCLPVCVCACV